MEYHSMPVKEYYSGYGPSEGLPKFGQVALESVYGDEFEPFVTGGHPE